MLDAMRSPAPKRHGCLLDTVQLPPGYVLDASDTDVLLLLRREGTAAAAFSVRGVTAEGILEAVRQDAWAATFG